MKLPIIICIILVCISSNFNSLSAQEKLDISIYKTASAKPEKHLQVAGNNKNEVEFIMSGLFLFYKAFISSQDGNSCNFTPSCSVYSLSAIKQKGIVLGTFITFDRLTRCNGLSHSKYPIDEKTRLYFDPVE